MLATAMGVNAQKAAPKAPAIPWGSDAKAELVITSDLTEQHSDGSWYLTKAAQQWITYESDQAPLVQQTNRANVWYDVWSDVDTMIVTGAEKNWGGYFTVTSRKGLLNGLIIVGKTRMPHFFVKDAEQIKLFFSGSAGTAGQPQIVVKDLTTGEIVKDETSDVQLTKSTWDTSVMLKAELDKSKSYEVIAKTGGSQGDLVLQALRIYGDPAPLTTEIVSGTELGSYINAYKAVNPDEQKFTLQPGGWYTIAEPIVANGSFQLVGGSIPATIDASELEGAFVEMSKTPAVEANSKGFIILSEPALFKNIEITGLATPLLSTNRQKYIFPAVEIENSNIGIAGGEQAVIDFFGGGTLGKLSINNSTIAATGKHTGYLFNEQAGQIAIQAGLPEQVFSITNSTLANISYDKQVINHRQRSQIWQTYNVKNSIIFDSGRKGAFLKGLNGGVLHTYPTWDIADNTFLWTEADGTVADVSATEETQDSQEPVKSIIAGVPSFANAAAGNYTVAESSKQAKFKIGDPRWLVPYATAAVSIEAAGDFVKQVNDALKESELPKSITVTFPAGSYETSGAIKTNAPINLVAANGAAVNLKATKGLTLGGAISISGINIDASALDAPFITLAANDYQLQENGFYALGNITIDNVTVTGLKQDLIYGNKVKNLIPTLKFSNSKVIAAAEKKTVFDFNGGGVVGTLDIVNSTIDANNGYIFSSQSGQRATEADLEQQTFSIQNSTIHKAASNSFQHRQNGQTWLRYVLKNSIISEPGRDNFVSDMNKGQQSANPVWEIDHNSFQKTVDGVLTDISDKQNTGDEAEPVQNSVVGVTDFADAAAGDFTVEAASVQALEKLGDPKFLVDYMPNVPFDYTAKVGTSQASWNGAGLCATQYAPAAVTTDGRTAQMVENYNGSTGEATGEYFTQTISALPNGKYTVTLYANAMSTGERDAAVKTDMADGATDVAYVYANDKKAYITAHVATATAENGEYTLDVKVTDGTLKLGLVKEKAGTNWHTINIKSLIYQMPMDQAYAEVIPEAKALAEKKMSNAAKKQLDAQIEAEQTVEGYSVLVAAVNAAKTSVASYEILAAGKIADNDLTNWTCTNGNTFHINTWSVEGNPGNDPTGMVTPFIENWVGQPGPLNVGEEVYTLAGLNPGEKIKVSALVRAYSEAGNEISGGSFFVGNEKVALTTGTAFEYGNNKGVYGTYTAEGEVDADGNFKFGVIHEAPTYNWVAIKNVTIEYNDPTQKVTTYDFAKAAAAGENPANKNGSAANGQAFYVWENEGKADSQRQDFKGYEWAEGSVLPEVCHVWRRSDRINGNIVEGGLNCPNDREMVIDGLNANATVQIFYSGADDAKIIYATGETSGAVATVAGAEAVSGVTEIASGAAVKLSEGTYFGFKVKKGMIISKVVITEQIVAAAAAGDVTYAVQVDEAHASADVVEVSSDDEVVATLTFGEAGGADFNAGVASGDVEGYVALTSGNGVNGNKAGGTWYTITPKYDGVVTAAVSLNSDKKFHIVEDGAQKSVFDNNTVASKYNGTVAFNVVGGKAYKIYCDGSKLGFYGFNYVYGPDVQAIEELSVAEQQAAKAAATRGTVTGIETVKQAVEDGAIYNLRGQRIAAPVKGQIYIQNGKKHIAK